MVIDKTASRSLAALNQFLAVSPVVGTTVDRAAPPIVSASKIFLSADCFVVHNFMTQHFSRNTTFVFIIRLT